MEFWSDYLLGTFYFIFYNYFFWFLAWLACFFKANLAFNPSALATLTLFLVNEELFLIKLWLDPDLLSGLSGSFSLSSVFFFMGVTTGETLFFCSSLSFWTFFLSSISRCFKARPWIEVYAVFDEIHPYKNWETFL